MLKRICAALLALALPATAAAFEAVDTAPYTSTGRFPAYPGAPEDPRAFWAQIGMLWDNNVLRRSTDERSELITRLGIGARRDVRVVGRQVLRLEAAADLYAYRDFNELDHVAYGLLGEWRWELGNDLSGTLGYARRQYQADPGEVQAPVLDRITEQRFYGSGAYRLGPNTRLRAAADFGSAERPRATAADTQSTGFVVGADYVTPLGNALGVEYRRAQGDGTVETAPLTFVATEFEDREVAMVATYVAGATLRFGGRVGHTERTYEQLPSRNFSGPTWRAAVDWLPGNKTTLTLETYKGPRAALDFGSSHVLVKGIAFGPAWAPTAKTSFFARVVRENRDYQGQGTPGDPLRKDTVNRYIIGSGWEITRQTKLGVALERGKRDSNVLLRDYQYTAAMANLRYDF